MSTYLQILLPFNSATKEGGSFSPSPDFTSGILVYPVPWICLLTIAIAMQLSKGPEQQQPGSTEMSPLENLFNIAQEQEESGK